MKRFHTFILAAITILLSLNESVSYAQLASKGNWNTTTIKKNLEIILTGDITIKGCITINSGYTLTILNNSDTPYTLSVDPAFANGTNIFANSGNLIIKGNQSGRITIDGGAAFTYTSDNGMPVSLSAGTGKKIKTGIQNSGNITLEYVTIQNINDSDSYGGAITSSISASKAINLRHCIITKCYSQLGSAIMITGGAGPVTIEDSEISKCFSGAGGTERAGGAIRTYGSVTSSLYLTRVSFRNNYSQRTLNYNNTWDRDGSGGAIFWNARGLNTTECVMNGCLFEYNKCDDNGGAIKTQGSIRFTGAETIIQNNMAPNGAGIYIEGYIGGSGVGSAREITYDLNNCLKVINNTSPSYDVASGGKTYNYSGKGAGIHFYFGSTMTLEAESTINVKMNGAIISNNESCGTESLGGGIYFENTSPSSKGYKFNINLNYGTVSGNKANKGGGIFVSKGDVLSEKVEGNSLKASGNTAEHGAGIYVMDGKLSLANGNITDNSSTGNGGGVYVNGGDFTMNDGSIKGNGRNDKDEVVTVNGGGVYVVGGGNFEMSDGEIAENSSTSQGGGVYIEGGDFTMNDGSIRSNNALDGGGVYLYNGNFSLVHGELNGNTASQNGGGVYVNGGDFTMTDGSIGGNGRNGEDEVVTANGGGVYIIGGGNFEMSDGEIADNSSTSLGGGVYIEGGDFTMNEGSIKSNNALDGGGVYLYNGNFSLVHGEPDGNTALHNGGGVYVNGGDFTMIDGSIGGNGRNGEDEVVTTNGGGVYIVGGGNFEMSDGEIAENSSTSLGGGVYIEGGDFTMNNGSIRSNNALDGGGVYLYNGNFSLVHGELNGNTATQNGGGVYLVGEECEYQLKNGSISNNTSNNGGGVYLADGSFILGESISDTGTIFENNVSGEGGGVYIDGAGDFTMNGGTVEKNSSTGSLGGGGIFLNGGDFTLNNGNISSNYSEAQGGGVYLNGGNLTVSQGRLSNNTSKINGGGIYILNGEVEMGSGEIRSNSCQEYGGGVYVYNSTDTKTTVDFSGGVLINNSASYGGGICVNGYIDLTIERVQIVENTATNGGGVCLMNNATMYFGIGEIRENIAVKKSSETYATGYGGDPAYVKIDEIQGFGGGIYLDSYTSLQFKNVNQLGLFKNLADSGGDEIFASGLETYVDLPDVGEMGVKGYPGASNLKWIEDYPNNDPYYYKGTKLKGNVWDTDRTNLRYRETISQNAIIFNLSGDLAQSGKYICFALGYEVSYITIIRKGLQNGESAIFHLRKNDANDFKIIMTGDGSDQIIKRVAVSAGTWTVTEMPWSWAYSQENRVITRDVPDPDPVQNSETGKMEDRPFVFTLTRTEDNHLPLNDEDAVINVMGE